MVSWLVASWLYGVLVDATLGIPAATIRFRETNLIAYYGQSTTDPYSDFLLFANHALGGMAKAK